MPELPAAARSFFDALHSAESERVRQALDEDSALVHLTDPKACGATPLNIGVYRRSPELIDLLLAHGAEIRARSDWAPGSFGVLDSIPVDAIELDDEGLGDKTGGGTLARHLVERGAVIDVHAAAHLGLIEPLRRFLDEEPGRLEEPGGDGGRPLHFAASRPIAELLVERGADIEARDVDHDSTPAQWAVGNRLQVCRYLVDRGATTDPFMAVKLGDVDLLSRELARESEGVSVRVTRERFPCTPSIGAGHIYMFTFGENTTLLHAAATRGDAALVRHLLSAGADPSARGGYDDAAPLHIAAWSDNTRAAAALLDCGADIDARSGNVHNNSPLGWAIVSGAANVAELLIDRGAEILDFFAEDAEAGVKGEFRKWSAAPISAWERIRERIAR